MSDESFKDAPVSIGEVRAEQSGFGSDWTPREALVAALRDLDAEKIAPDALIIGYREPCEDGGTVVSFYNSSPDATVTHGILAIVGQKVSREG